MEPARTRPGTATPLAVTRHPGCRCRRICSIVSAAIDRGKADDEKRKRYVAAWKVIARVVRAGNADISIPACRILSNSTNVPKGMTHKDLPDEVLEINPILQKAGLLKAA